MLLIPGRISDTKSDATHGDYPVRVLLHAGASHGPTGPHRLRQDTTLFIPTRRSHQTAPAEP